MRKQGRVDQNQKALVGLFRKLGCTVWVTSMCGSGAPDCVISVCGKNVLIEFKDGAKSPFHQRLTMDEQTFHDNWQGDIRIIRSEEEAINLVNELRLHRYRDA